ncbi:hypothetical protein C4573_03590 [Candidatus Woesearchaeota archaeon]|nr:MAG: hypothetical protein C4573_03590 [Candidatus Woesearchaeota archaeon]
MKNITPEYILHKSEQLYAKARHMHKVASAMTYQHSISDEQNRIGLLAESAFGESAIDWIKNIYDSPMLVSCKRALRSMAKSGDPLANAIIALETDDTLKGMRFFDGIASLLHQKTVNDGKTAQIMFKLLNRTMKQEEYAAYLNGTACIGEFLGYTVYVKETKELSDVMDMETQVEK